MNTALSVEVAVRHLLGERTEGGVVTPRRRTVTWASRQYRLTRPDTGRETVELDCPVCSAALLAEVRDPGTTRRVRLVLGALAVLAVVVLVAALAYAVHEGGRTLPEGESLPVLFPVSLVAVFLGFVSAPALWAGRRNYTGVSLLEAPKPRRGHRIVPVRVPRGRRR
ncbi:hypothetical protein [Streptomyces mangrovisoli]|uniref:Uncharacterized protein n=1 Tax=Streptomyces mangrovisoli TaxID=1428628 RepID=A0A1J4NPX2_9ACTN|nr:hypothetical protein [Streptomyces mangrovisoli]OIJ63214.1 hypothetical protein WN71_035485 [Streptomyces mangrovisoli]